MAITKSAKKAFRQSVRRRAQNLARAKAMREAIKKFKKAPGAATLAPLYQAIDKAAKTNIIHRNRAARMKSRLSKLLKK